MNIAEILDEFKVETIESGHHHCRPGWGQADCPWCGIEGGYHLGINLSIPVASCWRCGRHSLSSVLWKLGIPWGEIKRALGDIDPTERQNPGKVRSKLIEPKRRVPLMRQHRRYLEGRGFDPDELVRLWGIEGIGIHADLPWRIYIPITQFGKRVSWTARTISEKVSQRYVSASAEEEAVSHKTLGYGLEMVTHSAVIVEGPTDAWNVGPGAVGLFGTAFTPAQVSLLVGIPNRFICFDNSKFAQKKAEELAGQLSVFPGRTEIVVLDAEDPGSAKRKEIKALRRFANLD